VRLEIEHPSSNAFEEIAMTTRLTLILVAALASAPIVFASSSFRAHLTPIPEWIVDQDETTRVEAPAARTSADCVVIGSNLLQPFRVPSNTSAPSNRPIGLASGGTVACKHARGSGS
jgi:hypothetical protein